MFKKIDHIEVVTAEPEKIAAFYTDVLGFRPKFRDSVPLPDGSGTLDIEYLDLAGTSIELLTYHGVTTVPATRELQFGYRMFALEVDDLKEALRYLQSKGIEPVWGPVFRDKYARAEIQDPNGNLIELRQWND